MAVSEGLVFGGVDLNDGVNYTLRGIGFPVPKKRQEWVQGSDADGSALVRDPLFENRQVPARVRVNPQGTLTMDQALAKVGQLVDLIEEAERQPDGTPLIWTPAQGTKSLTLYALSGEITDNPIEKATQNSGWFLKAPMVGFSLDCKPFGYGQAVDTVSDDFSSDSITAGSYTFDTGGGTISVASGQLVPSTTAEKRLYRSKEGLSYCDSQVTVRVTTGASVASGSTQLVECRIDASNYLRAGVNFAGAASTLSVEKVVAAAPTTLATSGAFTTTAATSYWVRFRAEKNLLTVELWTSQPTTTGAAAQSLTYTLAGADATTFGQSVVGQSGLRLIPQASDYRFDDFQIEPNLWRSSSPIVTGLVPAIAGDATAEGRLVVTDAAGQPRSHVEFGIEQRYYSAGVPRILDQFATDTIGSGAWTVDSGAGTISVSGGLLVPSSTAEKRLHRTDAGGSSATDSQLTVKVTTGASVASGSSGLIARWSDDNNFLFARLNFVGATSNLTIGKRAAAADTTLATSANTTTVAATSYWIRLVVQGTTLTATYYAADPASGAAATSSVAYTLTTAEALAFAAGHGGLRLVPAGTDYRFDDFRIQPLAGATDPLLDSEDLVTSGFAGTMTTRAGAYTGGTVANQVVRGTLSTTPVAICGLGNLAHVGSFRVKARVYPVIGTTIPTDLKVRLSWRDGDGPLRSNDWTYPVAGTAGFSEVDLGVVSIPQKTLGAQRWTGQIEAYSTTAGDTIDIDYVEPIPTEVYGKARALVPTTTPTTFSARDEFDQTAGNLNGKALPVGGTWSTVGADATDLSVNSTSHIVTRATNTDTSGKIALAGTATFTDCMAQVDVMASAGPGVGATDSQAVVLRYVDASNYVRVSVEGIGSVSYLRVVKFVAGVGTIIRQLAIPFAANTWYSLRGVCFASGVYAAGLFPQGSQFGTWLLGGSDSALATGGVLATGKAGIFDINQTGAYTRSYDNFWAAVPVPDAVAFPGLASELRYDTAIRQDSTGTFYGVVNSYRGSRVFLPPAGSAGRSLRVAAKVRRNDVDIVQDDQIADPTWAQLKYTPRYIAIPR